MKERSDSVVTEEELNKMDIEELQRSCCTCNYFTPYQPIGTSHLKYFGSCAFIDSMKDPNAGWTDISLIITKSPVLINSGWGCRYHNDPEIEKIVKHRSIQQC